MYVYVRMYVRVCVPPALPQRGQVTPPPCVEAAAVAAVALPWSRGTELALTLKVCQQPSAELRGQ